VSAQSPEIGDLVVVLKWIRPDAELTAPYAGVVQTRGLGQKVRVSHPDGPTWGELGPGGWAARWRDPTDCERAAYRLGLLAGGGL
jgi:hypothetical protein